MKIIDAVWEKRNLGVDVKELICDGTETAEELGKQLAKIQVPYSVLKIPSGSTDLLLAAQSAGYHFMESSISLDGKVSTMALPRIYQRFEPYIQVNRAEGELLDKILQEIETGTIFETDRITRDPYFSQKIAGKRYANWTKDELNKGAEAVISYYKEQPVAFGINMCSDGTVYDAFLGGVFSEAANKGLGFLALYANMESIRSQGGTKIITHVSSNNMPILRLHMQYGYEITDMNYVLVRHNFVDCLCSEQHKL